MSTSSTVKSISDARARSRGDAFYPEPSPSFVASPKIEGICERASAYLDAGYPIHLAGPSGIGKTTLAFHIAAQLEQPAVLMHGNHEHGSSDLVGANIGYRKSKVVDNYIHSVLKTREEMKKMWVDNRLARACREGYTLIYDEFNRTKPDANNVLLSVFEEKLLSLPGQSGEGYVRVHPNFRAILTSNPTEYAGTHSTQDALMDRLVTIRIEPLTRETEVQVTCKRANLDRHRAEVVTDVVRAIRNLDPQGTWPSVRACVVIGRVLAGRGDATTIDKAFFKAVCEDLFLSRGSSDPDLDEHQFAEQVRTRIDTILE
jgi:gas vesicle protein GvpN